MKEKEKPYVRKEEMSPERIARFKQASDELAAMVTKNLNRAEHEYREEEAARKEKANDGNPTLTSAKDEQ